ncbi:hypothetical protein ACIBG0_42000 [Nocardia sp. NPDC050630]|uniref:hypothetical protein n=1 Tax=Nocardia sp. NPDC050630 TaxID=3364321 RepID=UPI0037AF4140
MINRTISRGLRTWFAQSPAQRASVHLVRWAYHPDAGQPIPFRIGGPLDVAEAIEEHGIDGVDTYFESPLPNGSGRMSGGGGGGMGNIGYLARLNADSSLRWVAVMFYSNPFIRVHYKGMSAVFTNDWGNRLMLDLMSPALR